MTADITSSANTADYATARVHLSRNWTGWINVVVAAVVMLATLPGRTQGLGLITEPMLRDLHLDRVTYATINLWATLLGAAICLPIGRLFDSVGLRVATFALTVLLGAVVWMMSGVAGGPAVLFLLVLATRALGQSALSVASITAVGKSFDRRVGWAMGIYAILLTVFMAAAFVAVGGSVNTSGWRTAWAQVSIGLVVFIAPLTLLLRERSPQVAAADADGADVASLTLIEAIRTPAFWVFGGATALFGLVSSGLGLFNEAVLAERGFDQPTYVSFLTGMSIVTLLGQFLCGWLTLRWSMQRLLGIAMFLYAMAIGALPVLRTRAELWIIAVLIGLAAGMIMVIFFAVWTRAFGRAHLGRIQGAAQLLTVVASAIGPLIFAQSAAVTGSYFPALWILAPCTFVFGVIALRVKMPRSSQPSALS
jgi:MFS family permease